MASVKEIAEHLKKNAPQLANELVDDIAQRFKVDVPKSEIDHAKVIYTEFLGFLGELLPCKEERVPEGLLKWSKDNGEREAANKGKMSDIISRYPDTRIVFTEQISKICLEYGLSPDELVTIITRVNYFLDLSINETVFAFERYTDQLIKRVQEEVNYLSAPVVPIQDGIAILPLIGSIDIDRAALILEKVVPKVTRLKVNCLILDFSGILTIDAAIAKHIFDIHNVLRLIGVETIATGIRPDLAQLVVSGGINLTAITSFATVRQAIDSMK
ncbi:rsbT co-antagonist protein RsbR [Peribacillus deserti]|uniref:RsbT co-antagonist protein RsbR n=1 Tax=Peribacillus deserti TaxID=673318 RepID=A0ABS2QI13_9BACI|nr:STAS domain-containing protein [Peribacillus deserti]MBM7692808.1 rsbT co-antagonist protein RsbR [Peribacillus deserti]